MVQLLSGFADIGTKVVIMGTDGTPLTATGGAQAPLGAGTAAIGKIITPSFSASDSITRPANTTAYAANKAINCSVAVTAMAYTLKVVTLTAANAFVVGDYITVAGVNTGFTVTNIDGNWICGAGTNATTVVFTVDTQPTGATPQTISVGTIAKCPSMVVVDTAGDGIILSELELACQGVAMTGAMRAYVYNAPTTVLVDQTTFTLLNANATARMGYFDFYPVTEGAGSDCTKAIWRGWSLLKTGATTRLFFRLVAEGASTPVSGAVITLTARGIKLLG
jgi:hypothetical protein